MHFKYNFRDGNSRAALLEYQCQSEETGAVMPPTNIGYGRHNVQNEEDLLDAVHANPQTGTCQVTYKTGLSQSAVWHTLHEEQLHPFRVQCTRATARGQ
jgi:hypothetical protein